MKAILTGATGFIGGGALEECIDHPDITSIVVLGRRPLPEPAASNKKVIVLVLEDFLKYSSSVLEEIKDADFCIWALGDRVHPTVEIEVGYSMAFCEAMAKARGEAPSKPFRMIYGSGLFARTDQKVPLWFLDGPRKAKGLAETTLLDFSEQHKQNKDSKWETYVVRPGGVLTKQGTWILTAFLGIMFIRVDVLAKALVETGLNGDAEKRVFHAALVKKGKAGLQHANVQQ